MVLRAKDGKVLQCKTSRGDQDVDQLIRKVAPGVVPVEEKKKDKKR